jgi:predicted ribosome quality control (RQC) complex YloA/Tae2 family protein
MKEGITSLDLMFLARELKEKLVDGKIQAIKQVDKTFIFEIYKQEKFFLKVVLPNVIYVTKISQQAPEKPLNFCMQLRKHLLNKTITDLRQHEFDRIIEVDLEGYKIIFELFSSGNLILTDSNNMIIGIYEQQEWKSRTLRPKTIYKHPPTNVNPFKYEFFEFQKILKSLDKDLIRCLAIDFGLGGLYAEEVCKKLEIEKNKLVSSLNQQEADKLFRFFEQLKSLQTKANIVLQDDKQVDVVPFELIQYSENKRILFEGFNEAVEAYFEGLEKVKKEVREVEEVKKQEEKIERITKKQEDQLKELKEREKEYKKAGQILYEKYDVISRILAGILKLKDEGKDWKEIDQLIKSEESDEARLVKELRPEDARIVFLIGGVEIEIDFRKPIEDNANYFFEQSKKIREKIERMEKIVGKVEVKPKAEAKPKAKAIKKWFERYRWFYSSNNILVIAGKNARNNETIIKRYVRPKDLVLHVDIHGSPFVVIRNDQKLDVLPPETIYEAAELAACYSSAWDQKLANVNVYYIKPEQVVKEGGLPLGSFMIKGERKWIEKVKLRFSIGIKQIEVFKTKLIFGPPTAVKKQTPYMLTIISGDRSANELAKEIKKLLLAKVPYEIQKSSEEIPEEEIKKIIPYGRADLVR